ncbi:MAG: hypothetical protein EBZ47_02940 [Chlamydiae bacterium]|nr:hypothetical protein [Chlamydiota bacterium]
MAKQLQEEKSKVEKEMASIKEEVIKKQEVRKTFSELAAHLTKEGKFEVKANQVLVISDMDVSDFLEAAMTLDLNHRLNVLGKALNRFSLDLILEGSIGLGEFNIADHSWNILAGTTGSLTIKAKPSALKRSINELVDFLKMLPVGQGFVLKPSQDLLIQGLSKDSMMEYYDLCQEKEDPELRQKGQDELFEKNSSILKVKGLIFKIYGLNSSQVDRAIDMNAGGILFKSVPLADVEHSSLVLVLLSKEKADS